MYRSPATLGLSNSWQTGAFSLIARRQAEFRQRPTGEKIDPVPCVGVRLHGDADRRPVIQTDGQKRHTDRNYVTKTRLMLATLYPSCKKVPRVSPPRMFQFFCSDLPAFLLFVSKYIVHAGKIILTDFFETEKNN